MIDASRLERVLVALHATLPNAVKNYGGELHEALLGERAGLVERLRAFLEGLRSLDLTASHHGMTLAYNTVSQKQLASVLANLSLAVGNHVASLLGTTKLRSFRTLLSDPFPDLLALTGRSNDENAHSSALAWLLDIRQAPTVAPHALRALATFLNEPDEWRRRLADATAKGTVSVRREVMMGREASDLSACDRIDLLISGPDFLIAIENKIWSHEHDSQTVTYSHWLDELPSHTLRAGLFLTPDGVPAACPAFKAVSYLELLGCLLEAPAHITLPDAERAVLAGYIKALASEVLRNESRVARRLEDRQ